MKKFIKCILPLTIAASSFTAIQLTSCSRTHLRLTRTDWEKSTKTALNECISSYGIDGNNYSKDNYVVFDFDNTSAIFDIEQEFKLYQIQHMCFDFSNISIDDVLSKGIDLDKDLSPTYPFTFRALINDIVSCYNNLNSKYGPFSYKGITDETTLTNLHNEQDWQDFAAKMQLLYSAVGNIYREFSKEWNKYILTGMTPQQVYDVERRCLIYASSIDTANITWKSKTPVTGTSYYANETFTTGVSVTDNIVELYRTLHDNGISIWIVSASQIDQVKAAADVFGLSQYLTGAIACTSKFDTSGKYKPDYDKQGHGFIRKDNEWVQMDSENPNIPDAVGKSLTIKDVIAPLYNNKGPIMGFGDSSGDFNFCSEFKDTKLVVCFNRANRSVQEGGGLMAAIAMYQKLNDITLQKANDNNDTLYCLQGRDENGKRSFRNSNKTILLGQTKEKLFKEHNNYALLAYIMSNEMSLNQAFNTLCIKGTKISEDITVGFLDQYIGYHTR